MNPTSTRNDSARWARLATAVVLFGWAGAAAANTGNQTPALPTGAAANDTCFLFAVSLDNQAHSVPAGWTAVVTQANNGTTEHVSMWWKRLVAGDVAPTVTRSNSAAQMIARIVCYTGVDATTPYVASALNATSNTAGAAMGAATAAVSTVGLGADAIVLHFIGSTATAAITYSAPAGVPTGTTYSPGAAVGGRQTTRTGLAIYSGLNATEGSTGTANVTLSVAAQDAAVQLALRPASVFTIGTGSADPAAGTVLPAGTANNVLDTFTLQASSSVTVSAIAVSLTGNTAFTSVYLSKSSTCATPIATVNSPGASVSFTVSEAVTTTESPDYFICGTVLAGLGTPTSVSANVTGVTHNGAGTWTVTDNDTGPTLSAEPQSNTFTIGNGSADPAPGTSLPAGSANNVLDTFTLQASSAVTVSAIAVSLTGNTAFTSVYLSKNATCATPLATVNSPTATVSFTVSEAVSTTASTNYYICGTISAGLGASTSVSANVTGVTHNGTGSWTPTDNDTGPTLTAQPPASNTLTIGNGSADPAPGTSLPAGSANNVLDTFTLQASSAVTVSAIAVSLTGNTAFTSVYLSKNATCATPLATVSSPTATVSFTVSEAVSTTASTNYYICGTVSGSLGAPTSVSANVTGVTHNGSGSWTPTDNDTGPTLTAQPPTGNTFTIGNGSADPAPGTVLPAGSANNVLDTFTLQATAAVTASAITVSLTGNTAFTSVYLSKNATCATPLATVSSPTATVSFTVSEAVSTTASTNYYICGTVSGSLGAPTSVSANVTGVTHNGTGSWTPTDNDIGPTLTAQPPTPVITVGNGTAEPSNGTIRTGQVGPIDAFSVQTNSGTATITAVVVNLTAGNAALSTLSINSNATCTGTTYGVQGSPALGNTTIALTTYLSATTTSGATNLYVCGSAATVAASTNVTGNVASVSAIGYTSTDSDSTNATLTVTPNVAIGNGSAEPANSSISSGQVGAIDAFSVDTDGGSATITAVVVSLTAGNAALANLFINGSATCTGTTYGTLATPGPGNNTIPLTTNISATPTSDITNLYVCGTAASVATSTAVTGNVASVTAAGFTSTDSDTTNATLTVGPNVAIGNGTAEPSNSTIRSGQVGAIDAFSVQTSGGTATITAVVVNLTGGSTALANLFINGNATCTGTTYGTVASPTLGNNTISLSTNIPATTTSGTTNLYVCGTAASVTASTAVTASVKSVTAAGYGSSDGDTTNATLTVAPAILIGNGSAEPANSTISAGQVGAIDAFSVQADGGVATITAVVVSLTAGNAALTNLFINANATCNSTTYGTLASPIPGNNTISLTVSIPADEVSGAINLYVCGTAATVAASTAVTGNVASVTAAGYVFTDSDTTNATLTVTPVMPALTVGNGSSEPPNSTITTGQVGAIDAFSVQTSSGTATLTAVVVNLASGNTGLTNLFINSAAACNGTTYGTLASPIVGNNTITLTTTLSATTTSGTTNRYVCGTAAAVASSVTVTGTVVSATAAGYTSTDNDTTSATLTIGTLGTTTGSLVARVESCNQVTVSAYFTGDPDGNATVTFSRSSDGNTFGNLAACTSLGGGSNPRVCVDAAAPASSSLWYRALFTDTTGGVSGTNPAPTASSVATPACPGNLVLSNPGTQPAAGTLVVGAATWTYVGQLNLQASAGTLYLGSIAIVNGAATSKATAGDLQLNLTNSAGTSVYSTGSWDGAKWVFGSITDPTTGMPIAIGTAATTFRVYATANYGAAAAENFAMNVTPANVLAVGSSGTTTGTAFTASNFTTSAPSTVDEGMDGNTTAPMVSIVNPARGKVVSGSFLVQIYVYSTNGSALSAVGLSTNGTAPTCAANDATLTRTAHVYDSPKAAMYSKVVSGLLAGTYTLKACAKNGTGVSIVSAPVTVTVRAAGTGDGALLVRDNSSQLCSDCHDQNKLRSHSSETTASNKGIWSTTCRDCHTPHSTRNLFLLNEQIVPPSRPGNYQSVKDVRIATTVGDSQVNGVASAAQSSFVNSDASGPCQVCHTRTQKSDGTPRWRNTGNSDTSHYAGNGTQNCTGCHSHQAGFAGGGESGGGGDCLGCHGDIFTPMNTTSGSYHHYMNNAWSGNTAGSGTTVYPTAAWSGTADTNRRCVMCHVDHNIFRPDVNASGARGKNLRTAYSLAPTTTTNFTNTDFDGTLAAGGLCVSCHSTAQTKSYTQPDGTTSTPVIDKAGYTSSVHNYTAAATFKDNSTFNGNCSKCHTDTLGKARQTSSAPNQFGLHDSALRRISNPVNDAIVQGTATGAQTINGVVDTGKSWTAGQYDGWNVTISDGSGTRSSVVVQTAPTALTIETPWATAPIAGTTKYVVGEPAEERLCKQCHSGGVGGSDPFNGRTMAQDARRFDQFLRVYGTGTITLSGTGMTGSGTTWYYTGTATFVNGNSTVNLSAPLANASSLVGWSIKSSTTPVRWYTIVAAPTTSQLVISPSFAETGVTGAYVIGIGDWYVKCDADTTGIWYRIIDVTSALAATIYPAYGGAACTGRTYVARSSPGHPFSITAGLHKPGEAPANGWNAGAARHVTCTDCHDPHKAIAGNHTPGATTTANLGAAATGTWGVQPTFTFRTVTGGGFTNNGTSVTAPAGTFSSADVGKNIMAPDGSVLRIKAYVSATSVTTTLYSGPAQSNATFRVGDPVAAPTYAPVTNMTTANAQYQLCLKCHSSYGYGATPPNTAFYTTASTPTGAAVAQTDIAKDFNPFQLSTHAIFEKGHNQPPANANPNWATSLGRKQNAPNTGLDNTFVDGWGTQSIVTCTDCHLSDSGEDPWGPHGSANQWLLRGIDPNVTVTIAGGTVVKPNNCYYKGGAAPDTGDRKNICLNCHRADVYGLVSSGGSSSGSSCNGGTTLTGSIPYQILARVNHPVDARSDSNAASKNLSRFGIYCMSCHGGASIGAIHGTNELAGAGGTSYRGKRFLNGAAWSGHTRASMAIGVSCTARGTGTDSVNTCGDSRTATGNKANYDYESGAD